MYGAIESAAAEMQPPLPFSLHQRKIDLGKNATGMHGWHHEVVPRSRPNLRILAATLSSHAALNSSSPASILDRSPPSPKRLNRHFEFACRAVSKMLYSSHAAAATLRSPAFLSSAEFISGVAETIAVAPRSAAHTTPPSAVLDAIASLMAAGSGEHCPRSSFGGCLSALDAVAGEMSKQTLRLDGAVAYFSSQVAVMQVFQAAAAHVEFSLSALIAAYCAVLFVHLRGFSPAFKALAGVFKSSSRTSKRQ
jgi:hypothetical protein